MSRIPCRSCRIKPCRPHTTFINWQHGQASLEYVVVCAVLGFVLFYPIQDDASPDKETTTVKILLDGFKTAYQKISYALSLPT